MNVLMITGDKRFDQGHPRFELQKSAVDELVVMYWGRGEMFPRIPSGVWDVVTVQDPFWRGLFAWHVARRLGARFNVQVHTDWRSVSLLQRIVAETVLRHADTVRVVSNTLKEQLQRFGVKKPITVLPIFVDIERFTKIERHPEPGLILWLGRFEDEKDPLLALEVLRKVRATGLHAKLVMLGKGSLEQMLHAAAKNLPVEFPGWRDPAAYLAVADVVLCTSRFESWGASIIEALAAGVPVVAPDVGVAREAGAIVVPLGHSPTGEAREQLAEAVAEALHSGARGVLTLQLPSAPEWAQQWRESL